jgi:hypothetical protein
MLLQGSCHCGAVKFSVDSETPHPYMRCYCSICRKTQGGGGYAINIMGNTDTLKVTGARHLKVYRAKLSKRRRAERSPGRRHFCARCGSALWMWDPRWPGWVYPFASAIDTPLPRPPQTVHVLLDSKANWVEVPRGGMNRAFQRFPKESIIDWHRKRGLLAALAMPVRAKKKRR